MASFNKVILMGNLTRDPQLKYLPSQMAVAEFGLAMNRKFRTQSGEDREEVTFIDCSAFGKTGELINQYFTKGKPIFVEGRIKYDSWEDKQGGGKRSKITVVVENFQFIGGREGNESGTSGGATSRGPSSRPAMRIAGAENPFGDEQHFTDDDVPFKWTGRQQQIV
jgi:single-strand DNA-binding protein